MTSVTYPPNGEPSHNQYYGAQPAPSGPPTGAFPGQPAAPGYPPQYGEPAAPGYPPPQFGEPAAPGYPPQPQYGAPQYPPPTGAFPSQPPGPPPTGAFPGQPAAPGYPPQYAPPPGYPPQPPPTQSWQAPGPPPGGPRGTLPWVLISVIAGVVVLALVGGVLAIRQLTSSDDPETPGAQSASTTGATTTGPALPTRAPTKGATPTKAAAPAKYAAPGDLCSSDLTALGPYAAKKEKSTPNVRKTGDVARSDCDFDLRMSSGVKVTFGIKTQVYATADDAKDYFDVGYDADKKRFFDADLSGLGEQSYGTNRDWDIGSKTSDYTIRLVDSNLYFSVSLVTFGTSFVPKDQLKPKVIDEAKALIAKLPKA